MFMNIPMRALNMPPWPRPSTGSDTILLESSQRKLRWQNLTGFIYC